MKQSILPIKTTMPNRIIRILSIDPGLTYLGYALSEYDTDTNVLVVHKYGNFQSTAAAKKNKEGCAVYSQQIIALEHLRETIRGIISAWKPEYVATEDAFLNHRFPNAYVSLSLCINAIAQLCYQEFKLPVYKLPPCNIKRLVTGDGKADKVAMQEAVLNNPNIVVRPNKQKPIEHMVEHEADAIGVGYAFTSLLPSLSNA